MTQHRVAPLLTFLVVLLFPGGPIVTPAAMPTSFPPEPGLELLFEADPPEEMELNDEMLIATRNTIARRIELLGIVGAVVRLRGHDQISVLLPGEIDVQHAIKLIQTTGVLEIIDPNGEELPEGLIVNTSSGGAGDETATNVIYETLISNQDIVDAFETTNQRGELILGVVLTEEAGTRLYDFTSVHIGEPIALLIDKRVVWSPVINGGISSELVIVGIPENEIKDLVIILRTDPLAVPLLLVESRVAS